jgi:hypothetical protein
MVTTLVAPYCELIKLDGSTDFVVNRELDLTPYY